METEGAGPAPESQILEAMDAAEPSQATAVLSRLLSDLRSGGVDGVNLAGMWESFKRLLHRRGFFVATAAQVAKSLEEIDAVGESFDLFDLARCLAQVDALRMKTQGLPNHRVLPELQRFVRRRSPGKSPKEK